MNNFIRLLKRSLRRNKPASNFLRIFPDDTFLVSFPRSGNTWTRFLLGYYLFEDKFDFVTKENFLPAIKANTNHQLLKVPRPRILKSHSPYFSEYPKVIYLVRDPRDVIVSHFHWAKKNPNKKRDNTALTFDQYAEIFLKGDFYFGRWDEHFLGWYNNSNQIKNGFLLIKYEDLKKDSSTSFAKIIRFLNLDYNQSRIEEAIKNASFENMKKLEKSQQQTLKTLSSPTGNIDFVGHGKSEWEEYLIGEIKYKFKKEFSHAMSILGYDNDW